MQIGTARLTPVVELEAVPYPLAHFFDGCDRAMLARHLSWLAPEHYDPAGDAVLLSHHAWLVDVAGYKVLIDPCIGNDKPREVITAYNRLDTPWLERLGAAGAKPDEIDFVVCTHLHVDHCGWNTRRADGRWVPTFPNARYIFSEAEHRFWEAHAANGLPPALAFNRNVYEDSVRPVVDAGLAWLVEGETPFADGFTLLPTPGHTVGHVAALLDAGSDGIVFTGDAIHHPLQIVAPDLNTSGYHDATASRQSRRQLLDLAADRGWLLAPAHFRNSRACRITRDGEAFRVKRWESNQRGD